MKTKTKMIALLEIAVVLCSVFLVAIPAIAADQNQELQKVSANTITTASEDDYVLSIYGNANEDDTIDMGDVVYIKLAIFGKKPKTTLCDAKYDGRINVLDVIQTKLIILGKEKELTVIDTGGRVVTVKKPIKRLFVTRSQILELLRAINIEPDRVVGAELESPSLPNYNELFFPEFIDKPTAGEWIIDCEAVLNENPDTVLMFDSRMSDACQDVLESAGVTVLRFNAGVWGTDIMGETKKMGYIFDKRDEAEEFVDFYNKYMNLIKEEVEEIREEGKPKVYFETMDRYKAGSEMHACCEYAGGKNIFPKGGSVDPEAIIEQKTDIIVKALGCSGGYHLDAADTAELERIRDEILSRPELQNVKAVKEGRVYVITGYMRYSHGCSGCKGFLQTVYMAKWFHPTLFEDLDPKAIHQEYLTRFQRMDYNLDEKGVFVYPKPG